jgi:hypothetical protein
MLETVYIILKEDGDKTKATVRRTRESAAKVFEEWVMADTENMKKYKMFACQIKD